MKTLYYSLRKVSQLTGLSPELIKELQREEPEELTPVEQAAGNPLYSPEQVEVLKRLGTKYMARKAARSGADEASEAEASEEDKKQPAEPPASVSKPPESTRPETARPRITKPRISAVNLHPLHRQHGGGSVKPSFGKKQRPPEKARPPASEDSPVSKTAKIIKPPARYHGDGQKEKNEQKPLDNSPDKPAKRSANYRFKAAISSLKSYKAPPGAENRSHSKAAGFNADLREIRDILQELHDRL